MRSDTQGLDPGSGRWKDLGRCTTPRLAGRRRGARGGLGKPLAVQRRRLRRRCLSRNMAANPADERQVGYVSGLGVDWRRLSWGMCSGTPKCLSCCPRDLLTWPEAARALLMYRFHTLMPRERRRPGWAGEGTLRMGIRRYRRGDGARSKVIGPDRQIIPYPLRKGGAAHHGRRGVRGLAILAGDQRRTVFARRRG